MSTKKEINNFLHEYFRGRIDYESYNRKIYLTEKDYVEADISESIFMSSLVISLYFDNRKYSIVSAGGSVGDFDGIWRRFRYRFKQRIAEEEKCCWDAKFLAKLKEIYSLL